MTSHRYTPLRHEARYTFHVVTNESNDTKYQLTYIMSRKKTSIFIHNDDETEPLLEGSHHNVTTAPGDETEGELTDGGEISDVGYIGDTDNESAKKKRKKTKNVKKKKKKKSKWVITI